MWGGGTGTYWLLRQNVLERAWRVAGPGVSSAPTPEVKFPNETHITRPVRELNIGTFVDLT